MNLQLNKTHFPVLRKKVLVYLNPKPNDNFIDATFGEGGHSSLILKKNAPRGKVLALELDPDLYKKEKKKNKEKRLILLNDSYVNLKKIIKEQKFKKVKGILFDLGLSSWHLEKSGRGFSFQKEEFLDMRYLPTTPLTAEKIINKYSQKEIEKILREYGQERFAKRIAQKIILERRKKIIKTTLQLVGIIKKAIPKRYHFQKIHPATRVFQALRIVVNNELENLEKVLPQALEILEKRGRIVIISFHSLEDRIVKNFFKNKAKEGKLKILTKKPIIPTYHEIQENPRCRSAKLRGAIKIIN